MARFYFLVPKLCTCLAPTARHHWQPGATPQELVHPHIPSAESAIHSNAVLGHSASMSQSLSNVILHIIFSTKDREPWLDSSIRPRMHAYLATICRDLGGEAFRADGVSDHVHIVTTLPR